MKGNTMAARALCLLLALALCACGVAETPQTTSLPGIAEASAPEAGGGAEAPGQGAQAQEAEEQEQDETGEAGWRRQDLQPVDFGQPFCEVPGGFLTFIRSEKPGEEARQVALFEGQLWFTDFATRRQQKVENGPFDLELAYSDDGSTALFYAGGRVYVVSYRHLYSMLPDGGDVRLEYSLWPPDEDLPSYWNGPFYTDGENFYALLQHETSERRGSRLLCLHLPTGQETMLYEGDIGEVLPRDTLLGCEGTEILLQTERWVVEGEQMEENVVAVNTQTGDSRVMATTPVGQRHHIEVGIGADLSPRVPALPLAVDYTVDTETFGSNGLWYFSLQAGDWIQVPGTNTSTSYQFHFDDPAMGRLLLTGVQHFYTTLDGSAMGEWALIGPQNGVADLVVPAAIVGDYYLLPAEAGNELGGLLILKEDYWAGTPNYLPITVVEE